MPGFVLLLLTGLGIYLAALIAATARWLTRPPRRTYAWAVARGRPGEPGELAPPRPHKAWAFRSRGLELPVWELRGNAPEAATIVLTHGWGESRVTSLARAAALAPGARAVVLWDLPGHGQAPGRCTLGGTEHEHLLELISTIQGPVVLYGNSLGAGLSIVAATRAQSVLGVIAECPYRLPATPAAGVLRQRGLPHRLNLPAALWWIGLRGGVGTTWNGFDRADHAAKLSCPLLVLHGDQDAVCPLEDGRAIAKAAPRGRLAVITGGGHTNLWTENAPAEQCRQETERFLRELHPVGGS